jgi:hypothetical protein
MNLPLYSNPCSVCVFPSKLVVLFTSYTLANIGYLYFPLPDQGKVLFPQSNVPCFD